MAPTVWYHVRDLDEGRRFYRELLDFEETAVDFEERWSQLARGEMKIGLAEGEPAEDGVAHVEVDDVRAEAERLREAGVNVGIEDVEQTDVAAELDDDPDLDIGRS